MSRLNQIEQSVAGLSDAELKDFAAWFDELRWQRWDRQIEADVKAGKLDTFIKQAKSEIEAGKIRSL